MSNIQPKPFLKWAGGKRQLLSELKKYVPEKFNWYFEPFVGAGALLFELQPEQAIINDINSELIELYLVIKTIPILLIRELLSGDFKNTEEDYYRIRNWDRSNWPGGYHWHQRATRMIYLNRTCYNGLYRVNSKGQFNVPYGKYKVPFDPDVENISAVSDYLNQNDVVIWNSDFEVVVKHAEKGDFVYFDPPYDPISDTSNFTNYTPGGFSKDDQIRLRNTALDLTRRGVKVMISNADTGFINEIYSDTCFHIHQVQAKRAINSKGSKRGAVGELIITNY